METRVRCDREEEGNKYDDDDNTAYTIIKRRKKKRKPRRRSQDYPKPELYTNSSFSSHIGVS